VSSTEIIIVLVVGALAALVKSTTGMGYPLVMLPVLALFIGIAEALVIVAPSNLFLNGKLMWAMREHRSASATLRPFLVGAVGGAVVGTLMLPFLPDSGLRIVLIIVIVAFLTNRISPRTLTVTEAQSQQYAPAVGGLAGLFQGAAGISGPIVTPWFLSVEPRRDVYILSIATVFAVSGMAQIVVFIAQGAFTWTIVAVAAALIPVAYIVFPVGAFVRERISIEAFERIVLVLLACSAVSLLVKLL